MSTSRRLIVLSIVVVGLEGVQAHAGHYDVVSDPVQGSGTPAGPQKDQQQPPNDLPGTFHHGTWGDFWAKGEATVQLPPDFSLHTWSDANANAFQHRTYTWDPEGQEVGPPARVIFYTTLTHLASAVATVRGVSPNPPQGAGKAEGYCYAEVPLGRYEQAQRVRQSTPDCTDRVAAPTEPVTLEDPMDGQWTHELGQGILVSTHGERAGVGDSCTATYKMTCSEWGLKPAP
ncbi:MAG: hypothetical protein GW911_12170 [Armatimonadetes bacterium]|nr:hypothetical protein [Armatimonadota bacterium]NCP30710.1 hypothetical protein [Armatimonadota bacterium]NCQ29198.1 hypothetical protein [Armatimonadota bacterium]NDK12789.1 hypothetical protein [Armatimonadota bacterium]